MPISGMTGFGRKEGVGEGWSWAVEARSVNGRNLEVRFRGPPGFEGLERAARELAQSRFQRGQLTVSVQARRAETGAQTRINLDQLERYLKLGEPLVAAGRAGPPAMDGLLALRGVIESGEEDDDLDVRARVEAAMATSLAEAMDALKVARQEEGAALLGILEGLVKRIELLTRTAAAEAASQPLVIKERFERRMIELAGEAASPERIVQEAAALAAKADVREELDRLASHVAAARTLLNEPAAAGRRLDFLTQEFMREANTLCSKSATTSLTATGLELKAAIDQVREQVQNVE